MTSSSFLKTLLALLALALAGLTAASAQFTTQAIPGGVRIIGYTGTVPANLVIPLQIGGTVLEIGPGHGRWSEWLVARAGLLVLCDVSPNCLDACRSRLAGRGRFRAHLARAADLPADLSGLVDAVWSYDCLVHVGAEECARYLVEIARVLRPGGVAVLHHADRRSGVWRRLMGGWGASAVPAGGEIGESGWRSRVSRSAIRRWARRAGLEVASQESTWIWDSPRGPVRVGVPRFGDCITVLHRADPRA